MGDKLVLRFRGLLETTQYTLRQSHGVPPVSVALDHTTLKEEDSCGYSSVKTVRSIVLTNISAVFPLRDLEVVCCHMKTPVVPKASPATLPELAAYLVPFASLFRRSTSRESVEGYLTGLLTDLPRKNCDTIAAAVAGTSTERLQHLLSDAAWEPQALDQQRVTALIAQSPSQGILGLDDTGLPKQGRSSVGVARQYSGTLGKVANC